MNKFNIGIITAIIASLIIGIFIGAYNLQLIKHVNTFSANSLKPPATIKIESEESVTIHIVKTVGPSVVTIVGTGTTTPSQPFLQFSPFGNFGFQFPNQIPQQQQTIGSGFIYSSNGLILTNKHVVSNTNETYQVITANNKKYSVKSIYKDPITDIAIIRINPNDNPGNPLTPVTLGDSSHLQVGQFVVAIGTALGQFRNTVTTGVVSGLGRGINAGGQFQGSTEHLSNVIQTDAAINPGNSGGPLVNSSGQVIGMNTAIAQNGQNIGFAIPINSVKNALNNFQSNGGHFAQAFLGVSYTTISQSLAILNNVPAGAYVRSVVSGSPADKAGIQQGDIIIKVDNKRIGLNNTQLATLINRHKVGDTITISIWRNGKILNISVTLGNAANF